MGGLSVNHIITDFDRFVNTLHEIFSLPMIPMAELFTTSRLLYSALSCAILFSQTGGSIHVSLESVL